MPVDSTAMHATLAALGTFAALLGASSWLTERICVRARLAQPELLSWPEPAARPPVAQQPNRQSPKGESA